VRSNRDLPGGGNIAVLEPFVERLREALQFAKTAGAVLRDAEAEAMWHEVYGTLKRSGDAVPHTDRARPHVLRLSLLFALADQSPVIHAGHLRAALAVWGYCRDSAHLIFGGHVRPQEPDPLWLQLLNAINARPGVKRGELTEKFKHKGNAQAVCEGLAYLEAGGMAYRQELQPEGGGRPAECWYPSGNSDDTVCQPDPQPEVADPWVVGPDATEEAACQETNTVQGPPGEVHFLAGAGQETNSAPPTGVSFLADALGVPVVGIAQGEAEVVSPEMPVTGPEPKAEAAVPSVEEVIQSCYGDNPTPKERAWAVRFVNAQVEYEAELRRRRGDDEPRIPEEEFIETLRAM
jgi:hypothetical protein